MPLFSSFLIDTEKILYVRATTLRIGMFYPVLYDRVCDFNILLFVGTLKLLGEKANFIIYVFVLIIKRHMLAYQTHVVKINAFEIVKGSIL